MTLSTDPNRHPIGKRPTATQRRQLLAWAAEDEAIADRLRANECRLRTRAAQRRAEAQA